MKKDITLTNKEIKKIVEALNDGYELYSDDPLLIKLKELRFSNKDYVIKAEKEILLTNQNLVGLCFDLEGGCHFSIFVESNPLLKIFQRLESSKKDYKIEEQKKAICK